MAECAHLSCSWSLLSGLRFLRGGAHASAIPSSSRACFALSPAPVAVAAAAAAAVVSPSSSDHKSPSQFFSDSRFAASAEAFIDSTSCAFAGSSCEARRYAFLASWGGVGQA